MSIVRRYIQNLWREMSPEGRRTLPLDLLRGGFEGAGHAFVSTFALLIAIQYYHCSDNLKSLIAAGSFAGLGSSFLYATYAHWYFGRRNIEAGIPILLAALCLFANTLVEGPVAYSVFCFLAAFFFMSKFPLMTAIYRENYKRTVRGQAFSLSLLISACSVSLITYLGGKFLDTGIEKYRALLVVLGTLVLGGGLAVLKIPSRKRDPEPFPNPFSYFGILAKDRVFVYMLFTWFIFGLANLSMLPQRLEYVSQERYGFSLSPGRVAFIVGVIPEIARMVMVIPMGRLFDRMNFIVLRILINFFFLGYAIFFFQASSLWMLILGSTLLGIGFAGGSIAWNLWVTKFALPSETAKYMAMHTFFNGIRGILGPYFGYWIARNYSIPTAGWISAGLIVISTMMLVPLIRQGAPNDVTKEDLQVSEV